MKFLFLYFVILSFLQHFQSEKHLLLGTRLSVKVKESYSFCRSHNFDSNICVLVDMNKHSGKNRLFVYDFKKDTIVLQGLCSHGCGTQPWGGDFTKTTPVFSNVNESHCSSIGKYKIGKRGYSNWGININYKLHGLDVTNDNAYKRIIVLHSWEMVPNQEPYPHGTPEGWGCPAVSNETMRKLDKLLENTDKPVLLWVYE